MKIDGKAIAGEIYKDLASQVAGLNVVPTLTVIQVGSNQSSTAYINQKKKAAARIGARVIHQQFDESVSSDELKRTIEQYNTDTSVHGLILQRPLPGTLSDAGATLANIVLQKDVDGFLPNSPYPVPVAHAVLTILEKIFRIEQSSKKILQSFSFDMWLKRQRCAVLGRGETAGKPIADALIKLGCQLTVIHSQTPNPDEIIKTGDIVISCVGKTNIVRRDNCKIGSILIGVGLLRDSDRTLHSDFNEEELKDIVAYYTPTPGGVGPLNVACLMENVVRACKHQIGTNSI